MSAMDGKIYIFGQDLFYTPSFLDRNCQKCSYVNKYNQTLSYSFTAPKLTNLPTLSLITIMKYVLQFKYQFIVMAYTPEICLLFI